MFRRQIFLTLLIIVVSGDSAFGGRFFGRRHSCIQPCPCRLTAGAEKFCLQSLEFEDPSSPGDGFFDCQYYPSGCTGTHYSDVWYGTPDNYPPPESCDTGNCENGDTYCCHPVPGHGCCLNSKPLADKKLQDGLTKAGNPAGGPFHYYRINKSRLGGVCGLAHDIYIVAADLTNSNPSKAGSLSFAIQTEDLGSSVQYRDLDILNCGKAVELKSGGSAIRIEFRWGLQKHYGIVWLK
jgi:hypothetical protein